MAEFIDYN